MSAPKYLLDSESFKVDVASSVLDFCKSFFNKIGSKFVKFAHIHNGNILEHFSRALEAMLTVAVPPLESPYEMVFTSTGSPAASAVSGSTSVL